MQLASLNDQAVIALYGDKTVKVHIDVILGRVRVTIVAVEKQQVLHILSVCVCSLSYPARKAHSPYCIVICGLPGSTIFFFTLSHKRYYCREKKTYLT
jgi:hypothetical protein